MSIHLLAMVILLITCSCLGCDARAGDADDADIIAVDFVTLAEDGIASYIGRRMVVTATVTWQQHSVSIPEDPRTSEEIAREAGPLLIALGPTDAPAFKDLRPSRRHLRGVGPSVQTLGAADGREQYAVGDQILTKGRRYRLEATLRLREGFEAKLLDNPAFVNQTNDPRYWSQTLELELHAADPAPAG